MPDIKQFLSRRYLRLVDNLSESFLLSQSITTDWKRNVCSNSWSKSLPVSFTGKAHSLGKYLRNRLDISLFQRMLIASN